MNRFRLPGLALLALFAASCARADILVGQTAGFSGQVASGVKESAAGAKLYIDHVNATGGVNGEPVVLVSMDDKFEPAIAASNARELITKRNVVALFLTRGTRHAAHPGHPSAAGAVRGAARGAFHGRHGAARSGQSVGVQRPCQLSA